MFSKPYEDSEAVAVPGPFLTHTVWYLALAASSAAMAATALAGSENRRFIAAFMLGTVGLFYIFEYVLVMMNAYSYSPMIFPDDPFLDTYMGNVFSQPSIAAASALIIVRRLRPYWYVILAAAYFAVELLFVRLGIFTVYWYRTIYTPIILPPLFYLLRLWHDRAAQQNRAVDGFLLHFLGVLAAAANTVSFPLRLLNLFIVSGGLFGDPSKDHAAAGMLYNFIVIGMLVLAWRSPRKRTWMPVALTAVFIIHIVSWKAGFIVSRTPWFASVALVQVAGVWLWVCLIGYLVRARLRRPCEKEPPL